MFKNKNMWQVSELESGAKLAAYLKNKCEASISARQIKRSIEAGLCRLNGTVERFASRPVGRGDKIEFQLIEESKVARDTTDPFLYFDDDIIAYNKPTGITSEDPRLLAKVEAKGKGAILLHRLDRDTTGVLLFARNPSTAEAMLALFKGRRIDKTYWAIVDRVPKGAAGKIENYIGKLHVYEGQTLWGAVDPEKGNRAITYWKLIAKSGHGEAALIECRPETGRTHQIRVHLSGLGYPILGDHQYGKNIRSLYPAKRTLLHAAEISFVHPKSKQVLVIKAPLPHDFEQAMTHFFTEQLW